MEACMLSLVVPRAFAPERPLLRTPKRPPVPNPPVTSETQIKITTISISNIISVIYIYRATKSVCKTPPSRRVSGSFSPAQKCSANPFSATKLLYFNELPPGNHREKTLPYLQQHHHSPRTIAAPFLRPSFLRSFRPYSTHPQSLSLLHLPGHHG
jgi:hypothetical protein